MLRDRLLLVVTGAVALLFAIPSIVPMNMGADGYLSDAFRAEYCALLGGQDVFVAPGSSVPTAVQDAHRERPRLLEDILSAETAREFCVAVAAYESYLADTLGVGGTLISNEGIDPILILQTRVTLASNIARMDNPAYYYRSTDVPLAYYASYGLSSMPYFLLYLPGATVAYALCRACSRDRVLSVAPVPSLARFAVASGVIFIASVGSLMIACVPGCLISLVHNGWGDISYPVVFVASGDTVQSSIGTVLAQFVLLYASSAFCLSLILGLTATWGSALGCALSFAVYVFLPLVPGYFSGTIPSEVLLALPMTYLDTASVAGFPDYLCGLDIAPVFGRTSSRGLIATVLVSCLLVFGSMIFCALSKLAVSMRAGRRNA